MAEKEYIERTTLEKFVSSVRRDLPLESPDFLTRDIMLLNFEQYIHLMPAADVAPVRHGHWKRNKSIVQCDVCGFRLFPDGYFFENGECTHANEQNFRLNFCPNCGAKMDGDSNAELLGTAAKPVAKNIAQSGLAPATENFELMEG